MEGIESPLYKAVKSKFTRIRCAHITWQVLEETRLFYQRLGPNDFTNRGPRRFPTADLGGLIEDVRRKKFLDSVTMPRQWNHQENINTWVTHQVNSQGGGMQTNRVYSGNVQRPKSLNPYATDATKRKTTFTGERMSETKSRTLPSSACQIYGKVPAKIFNTSFRKSTSCRKQNNKIFAKILGKLTWLEGHVHASHFGKIQKPKLLVLSCTGKII